MVKLSELYLEYTTLVEENQEIITQMSNEDQLELYSYFKQAEVGDCNIDAPMFYEIRQKAKYNAWNNLMGMSKNDAKKHYIKKVKELLEVVEENDN